jgi:transcriptional regulator with XRE-family HTH domain
VNKETGKQASKPFAEKLPPEIQWFGANLRRLRQESGKTLRDFCAETGMSYSFLSNVELGKTNLGLSYAIALSRLVGVPFTDMIKPPAVNKRIFRAANFVADEEPEASAKAVKHARR